MADEKKDFNITGREHKTDFDRSTLIENGGGRVSSRPLPPGGAAGPDVIDGKYRIVRQLDVVSAEADLYIVAGGDGREYVLKYYRFNVMPKMEVLEALKTLSSEDVIKLMDYGRTHDGRFYEILEHAEYGSLADYMKNNRNAAGGRFIRALIAELNLCLEEIHSKNIIHRDIKPSNILIRTLEPLDIVLTDFGISSVSDASLHQTNLSRTISYSAPETITGVISKSVDYWAFGLILLEIVIGRHPYEGMDEKAILFSLATRSAPYAADLEGEFGDIVRGLLTRDDKKRWGADQVNAWVAGNKDIPVYFENDAAVKPRYSPFTFEGRDYYYLNELCGAFAFDWEKAAACIADRSVLTWIGNELENNDALITLECLLEDPALSDDEKLFEFICRNFSAQDIVYRSVVITRPYLVDMAARILKNDASLKDVEVFGEVFTRRIVLKFHEIYSRTEKYEREYGDIFRLACGFKEPEEFAMAVILIENTEYKNELAAATAEKFDGAIIVKPFAGAATAEDAALVIEKIRLGRDYELKDLISAFKLGRDHYMTQEELAAFAARVKEKYEKALKNLQGFKAAAGEIVKTGADGLDRKFIDSLLGGVPEYTFEYYKKMTALEALIEKGKERVRSAFSAAGEPKKSAFISPGSVKAPVTAPPERLLFFTQTIPFGFITGFVSALVAFLGSSELLIVALAYFLNYVIGNQMTRSMAISSGVYEMNPRVMVGAVLSDLALVTASFTLNGVFLGAYSYGFIVDGYLVQKVSACTLAFYASSFYMTWYVINYFTGNLIKNGMSSYKAGEISAALGIGVRCIFGASITGFVLGGIVGAVNRSLEMSFFFGLLGLSLGICIGKFLADFYFIKIEN